MDATAPITDRIAAVTKTMTRPEWNGSEISCGKNVCPVSVAVCACVVGTYPGDALYWVRMAPMGLYPRNAANRLPTGGAFPAAVANPCATPCEARPLVRAL